MLRYSGHENLGHAAVNMNCRDQQATIFEHVGGCAPRQQRNGSNCVQVDLCQTYTNLCDLYPNSICVHHSTFGYQCLCPLGVSFRRAAQDMCQLCATCRLDYYSAGGCSGTSDRLCRPCTTCGSGFFEIAVCTNTSDRECSTCTTCASGFNETSPCTSTLDRVCKDVTPPSLVLLGDSLFFLEYGQDYAEPGFEARDRNVLLADDAVVVVTPQFDRQVCEGC